MMIFILKAITAICSAPCSEGVFVQTAFEYAACHTHCFNILAIKVKKKKKENSIVILVRFGELLHVLYIKQFLLIDLRPVKMERAMLTASLSILGLTPLAAE